MVGKSTTNDFIEADSVVFSKVDTRKIFKVDQTISKVDVHSKPENSESSVLRQVLLNLTGRKNLIDDNASLYDYLYFFPNRQNSIRQLRSEVFSYLSSNKLSTKVLQDQVLMLSELRAVNDLTKKLVWV